MNMYFAVEKNKILKLFDKGIVISQVIFKSLFLSCLSYSVVKVYLSMDLH